MFLRCELFHVKKAALRLVRHLDFILEIFDNRKELLQSIPVLLAFFGLQSIDAQCDKLLTCLFQSLDFRVLLVLGVPLGEELMGCPEEALHHSGRIGVHGGAPEEGLIELLATHTHRGGLQLDGKGGVGSAWCWGSRGVWWGKLCHFFRLCVLNASLRSRFEVDKIF